MKKIFIACSKWNYQYVIPIKRRLEQIGYSVILPNFFDNPMIEEKNKESMSKEDHIKFCKESFRLSRQNSQDSDMMLVLNINKVKDNEVYPYYIGGATFLDMYDSYLLNHPIFLYNDIPNSMLYDETGGMDPIIINQDLFKITDYDSFDKISSDNNLLKYFSIDDLYKIKECDDEYLKACIIVRKIFSDKVDKAGNLYINHLKAVSDGENNDETDAIIKIAGLLHDTVEDTEVTCIDLLELGFSRDVIEIVLIVTKPIIDNSNLSKKEKLELYNREIDDIINTGNMRAIKLKIHDMSNNFDEERLAKLPIEKQEWFREKYGKQLIKLKNVEKRV